ncbi:MAG: IPExxxVDY family protein [Bacteroidales bacterium]|nr:IPExxxVDY family protein [Bacteroidales bacterium]
MGTKRHKLSVSIGDDYCLLGIVSDEPDYKIGWLFNQQLDASFARGEDLFVFNKKLNEEHAVSVFLYHDERKMLTYRLISNRLPAGYFLSDLKQIDYVLHIQGEVNPDEIGELIQRIGSIDSVRMCVPVDLKRIKEQDRLQLW